MQLLLRKALAVYCTIAEAYAPETPPPPADLHISRLFLLPALLFSSSLLMLAAPALANETKSPVAQISPTAVSAQGKQSAIVTLKAFGRYAITAESAQGVALQAVDKMSGAGNIAGVAGKQDGRLDLFLDKGSYKIVTHAARQGKGQAKLSVHTFTELNGAKPPLLVKTKLEQSSLGDFEQRSYWIELKEAETVAIEAAGRNLADLRLWRDGLWLVENTPEMVTTQARPERPLAVARFSARLEPGLYLVTAYGGPSQPWTEESKDRPFLIRYGIPKLAGALRQQFTMGEFGVERFIVPEGANFFRLELPVASNATLRVGSYNKDAPFQAGGYNASIDKRSLPPVAELNTSSSDDKIVTVSMDAGKSFLLQHFNASTYVNINTYGNYWVSSIHAGHAEDSIGAAAIMTRHLSNGREEYVNEQVTELEAGKPWHRRFNLLDELTLFVKINSATKVTVVGEGVKARYRFEPFLTSRANDYKTPPWQDSGHEFQLDQGLYVLSVTPETRGILDMKLEAGTNVLGKAMSLVNKLAAETISDQPASTLSNVPLTPVNAVARFMPVNLGSANYYTVYLNRQPGVASGIVVRPLPINLNEALPVTQRAGEKLSIPVQVNETGTLRAIAEDGHALEIMLDSRKGTALEVSKGNYTVVMRDSSATQNYTLALEPARLSSKTPLPPLPDATLASLPKFPDVYPNEPHYLDMLRNRASSFRVKVDKPGLYQFESTGLLRTAGKVRTRINPQLFSQSANGVGNNFLIQNYLNEGEYQLTVNTLGQTQGHLGVQLARTGVIDGGELRTDEVARAYLPSAQAIAYRFRIAKRGNYRLQAMGLGRNFRLRLEDANGWPVFAPVMNGDFTEEMSPGNYRLIILPETADARVLTRLVKQEEAKHYKGHGPHHIKLEQKVEHVWMEPAKGGKRTPDQWDFDLPGAADVNIQLDSGMTASLVSVADSKRVLAKIEADRNWSGALPAGRYRLLAQHSRNNNRLPYALQVSSLQLQAGLSREILAPATLPLTVGSDGLIELQSFGPGDVKASLLNEAGETVAQNDDRDDDWNFHIAQRLSPGKYTLQIDPVNVQQAQTSVIMRAPAEVQEKNLALDASTEIKDDKVHVYPLAVAATSNTLLASAQSSDTVGLALEADTGKGWITLGSTQGKNPYLLLPLGTERNRVYRLRAWNADRRSMKMSVRAVATALQASSESQLQQGNVKLENIDGSRRELRAALVQLSHPGTFRIKGDLSRLQWSDGMDGNCATQLGNNAVIVVSSKSLWLVTEQRGADEAFNGERLRIPDGEHALRLELLPGHGGMIDIQPGSKGPSVLIAETGSGQPGLSLNERQKHEPIGLVAGTAVAVALPGSSNAAYIWNAGYGNAPIELDVRQVSLQSLGSEKLRIGSLDGTIAAKSTLPFKLPGGQLSLHLTLAPRNAAVLMKRGTVQSIHWAGEASLQESVSPNADELWLLNTTGSTSQFSVEANESGSTIAALVPGELFEQNLSTVGRLQVLVEIPRGDNSVYRLHVNGDTSVLWQENSGRILSGNDIAIRDSGVLLLSHQPGTLVAWLDSPPQAKQKLGDWFKSLRETVVKPPQTISLNGKSQNLALKLEQPALLHVRTSVPVVTHFLIDGKPAITNAHLQGANINLLAPAGTSHLVLRAVGADSLSGVSTIQAAEIRKLGEGLGPEVLLAPGGGRLFAFELAQKTQIGIGIRASTDVIRCTLYDAGGNVQSSGVVQMPTLLPGRYFLAVEAPVDTVPVQVQPVIFGLNKPDTRPPYEILKRYVDARNPEAIIYNPREADEQAAAQAAAAKRRMAPARMENGEAEGESPGDEGEGGMGYEAEQPSEEEVQQ